MRGHHSAHSSGGPENSLLWAFSNLTPLVSVLPLAHSPAPAPVSPWASAAEGSPALSQSVEARDCLAQNPRRAVSEYKTPPRGARPDFSLASPPNGSCPLLRAPFPRYQRVSHIRPLRAVPPSERLSLRKAEPTSRTCPYGRVGKLQATGGRGFCRARAAGTHLTS